MKGKKGRKEGGKKIRGALFGLHTRVVVDHFNADLGLARGRLSLPLRHLTDGGRETVTESERKTNGGKGEKNEKCVSPRSLRSVSRAVSAGPMPGANKRKEREEGDADDAGAAAGKVGKARTGGATTGSSDHASEDHSPQQPPQQPLLHHGHTLTEEEAKVYDRQLRVWCVPSLCLRSFPPHFSRLSAARRTQNRLRHKTESSRGVEAQQRMKNGRVCVIGVCGLAGEILKNIALSGVGALTIVDHRNVQ